MVPFSKTFSLLLDRVTGWSQVGRIRVVSTALLLTVAVGSACSVPAKIGGSVSSKSSHEADRRAINALNDHDVKAALASDVEAIVSQWTDDFTVIPPSGPIVRGRSANAALAAGVPLLSRAAAGLEASPAATMATVRTAGWMHLMNPSRFETRILPRYAHWTVEHRVGLENEDPTRPYEKRAALNSEMSCLVAPSSARSARISPTTLQNL